jgi:hypothetical protein
MWLMDWMLDAARSPQTSGFVLPVAAVALIAMTPMAAIATRAGTRRRIPPDAAGISDL